MRRFLWVLLLFVFVAWSHPLNATQAVSGDRSERRDSVGRVDFQVSCAPAVRDAFDQAVAMLHHMMYFQARGAFEEIADTQPECAMAQWGVAMTLFQPLWPTRPSRQDRDRGWEAVQRAQALEPATAREQKLLSAAAAFFKDPEVDEWWPRIERWADALETAYRERPEDNEIAAFYGLSLIAAGQTAEDELAYRARAAEILAKVHDRKPRHPGAIHYTIHASDATGRASKNLDIVESYRDIAPNVPHALHMPSHIYVRLGRWPEVIEWNRRSAKAALEHPAGDRVSLHYIHALDYNLYGYLQRGDDTSAAAVLDRALSAGPYQEDFVTAFHLAIMPARYAVERRAWKEAARITPREPDYLAWERYEWPRALSWFALGMGAVHTGDVARAREAESQMVALRDQARKAGERAFGTYIEIDRLILSGRIAQTEGDARTAVTRMEEAAALETTVEKNPVTPGALMPPHEALGDLLTELNRPADALAAYEASLEIWPRRYRSILGAARAAAAAGKDERSRKYYAELIEVVGEVETERTGVQEARRALKAG